MRAVRIVMEADLQWDHPILTQVHILHDLMTIPIPKVQLATIFSGSHILQIETSIIGIRCAKLATHHDIVARLIPEVIVVAHTISFLLPTSCNIEILIQQQETTGAIALTIA